VRVLHVIEAVEAGVVRHVRDVVRHVDAEHLVALPSERIGGFTDTPAMEAMADAGAELHTVPMRRSPVAGRNVIAVTRVRRLIRARRPDVVHGHASIGGVAARLAAAGTGTPRVYTPNGILTSRGALAIERRLRRLTDRFIAVSPTEAELAARLRIAEPDRIVVVPNGIELDDPGPPTADLRKELGAHPDAPVVGTVTRLAPQKAPEVFVRACALVAADVPDARFVLVGDGPLAATVDAEIERSGLGDRLLHLRGLHGAATVMAQLDVFALASRYEGGPYTPLEAMRAGTPVVLTDVIGTRDTVEDGRSGLLVPPDDPADLARGVIRVLRDPKLARTLAEGGRERVAARFDVRAMTDQILRVYESVTAAPSTDIPRTHMLPKPKKRT
jgi:glycosyltransferase involved in cell wall biosynthesis